MKFDVIVMNPPYQDPNNKRDPVWQKFVKKFIGMAKENGYFAFIHPSSWRKSEAILFDYLKKLNIFYLEIHNQRDGIKTFNCGTRYDWYVGQKKYNEEGFKTKILDENNILSEVQISNLQFVPNKNIQQILKLIASKDEPKCNLVISYSNYETRKNWMSENKNDIFKYPCIHTIGKKGIKLWYSNTKDNGFFGIKKVVFYDGSTKDCFFDKNGEYGMTQHAFAIIVSDDKTGENIVLAVKNKRFQEIAESLIWAGFAFDFRSLKYFRKDFWKEFVNEI